MLTSEGHPTEDDVAAFTAAGYTDRQVLELILAIAMKTISNWSNHVFDTPVDEMFAGRVWSPPESS
jgi:alkylhydroperoxidase family enzyme